MELIDRYVYEVGRHLPHKTRTDLETEIRSLLQDMLEARSQEAGHPIDEDLVLDVLKEYGPPEKVAAAYLPERYLIGPQLYPGFLTAINIAAPIIVALAILRFGITLGQGGIRPEGIIYVAAQRFANMVDSALQTFGIIVVIFAILQWAMPSLKLKVMETDWDPRKMGEVPITAQVSVSGKIMDIGFAVAALIIFNFYPQVIAIVWPVKGIWDPIPFLNNLFFDRYLIVLNIAWILEIILGFILLRQGYWQIFTYWFSLGVKVINIAIAGTMLAGPSILYVTPQMLVERGFPVISSAQHMVKLMDLGLRWVFVVILVSNLSELVRMGYRFLVNLAKPVVLVKE